MQGKIKLLTIFVLVLLISIVGVMAAPPFITAVTSTSDEGYDIKYPVISYLKINTDYEFNFHVFNKSNGLFITNETAKCEFHLYNSTGNHIINETVTEFDHDYDFEIKVGGGNFSKVGFYSYIFQCNGTDNIGGFVSAQLIITETGFQNDESNNGLPIMIFILSITFMIFLIPFYVKFHENEIANLVIRRGCWILTLFLMVLNSAIAATLAEISGLPLTSEMFTYMFIFGWAGYVGMMIMGFKTMLDFLNLMKERKQKKRFGE